MPTLETNVTSALLDSDTALRSNSGDSSEGIGGCEGT